jgi:hypothetical protein
MSRLKRLIQTAFLFADAHRAGTGDPFKQKMIFRLGDGIVASPHRLARQALRQNGSIIFERPFAKKSGVSLCGKLCCGWGSQE